MLLTRSPPCTFAVLLLKVDSLDRVGLFSVKVVVTSALPSVESLPSGEEPSSLVSVDPLSDEEPSSLESEDPPDASSLPCIDPLAYMIAEAGKIIEIIIKNINEIVILFIVANELPYI
jgi:hypothetical protein